MRRSNSNLDGRALLCAFHALCTRNRSVATAIVRARNRQSEPPRRLAPNVELNPRVQRLRDSA